MKKLNNKDVDYKNHTEVIIPKTILKEFCSLILMGVQESRGWPQNNWTSKEKKAYKFADKLIQKYG